MKVLNLVTQMEAAGAQGAAIRLSQAMRSRGIMAETWFLYVKRPVYADHVGTYSVFRRRPRHFLETIALCVKLLFMMRRHAPDVVITRSHYANIIGQIAALMVGVKVRIATQVGHPPNVTRFARFLDCLLGTTGVYRGNIVVSRAVADGLGAYPQAYRAKIVVVYNGIDVQRSPLTQNEARGRLGLPLDVFLIVNTGRLSDSKNHAFILSLIHSLENCHLAIAGDGELRETLLNLVVERQLTDRVSFLGELPPGEIQHFLRAGDVFVFPSKSEGFSNSVLEAAGAGLPLVVSDLPAFREFLERGEQCAAYFVPVSDKKKWLEILMGLRDSSGKREQLSRDAIQISGQFSLSNMVEGYLAVISGILGDVEVDGH